MLSHRWIRICTLFLLIADMGFAKHQLSTEFDYFIFAQSWLPQLCHKLRTPKGSAPTGCTSEGRYIDNDLIVHGLWPSRKVPDRSLPHLEHCAPDVPFRPLETRRSGPNLQLRRAWPNVYASRDSKKLFKYHGFWHHEWKKHGTCTDMTQKEYMKANLNLHRKTRLPPVFVMAGEPVPRAELTTALEAGVEGSVVLRCEGSYLLDVYTCYDQQQEGNLPGSRIECPNYFQSDCPENIRIRRFPDPEPAPVPLKEKSSGFSVLSF